MKANAFSPGRCLCLWIAVAALNVSSTRATVFTSDTTINVDDTTFDGADIVITNCTVTVDGRHAFNSLQVRKGGVLTHTQIATGGFVFPGSVTGEVHVLSMATSAALSDSNALINTVVVRDQTGTITYTNGVDYSLTQPSNTFIVIDLVPGSAITDGSTVLVDYNTLRTVPTGLNLAVTGDAFIESGGVINVNAKGLGAGVGPGHGSTQGSPTSGGGGGYGGCGGSGFTNSFGGSSYGSVLQPIDKGSGGGSGLGGPGSAGGGAVNLTVGGLLQISGIISASAADATNSRAGGGAGGSIWLQAQTVAGAGSLQAEGGAGEPIRGGGGGGGRIAIYAGTNLFSGSILARGGSGFVFGGAGTIYTRDTNQPVGQVLVDNGGRSGTNSIFASDEAVGLTIQAGAIVTPAPTTDFGAQALASLLVASNASLSSLASPGVLYVVVNGPATIQAGGGILADGKGFLGAQGPGAGSSTNAGGAIGFVGGGGGYGGSGGSGSIGGPGGNAYGSFSSPVDRGSGGGGNSFTGPSGNGGSGGGFIRLTVQGPLVLNGKISAGGNPSTVPNAGGGSGGTVLLTAMDSMSGAGAIQANGGAGIGFGGGGGGGRIAISYGTSNTFSGVMSAFGGGGGSFGGAGTIIRKQIAPAGPLMDIVIVDNDGHAGAVSALGSGSSSLVDLSVIGGGSLPWPSSNPFIIRNLLVGSNATMLVSNFLSSTITVSGDASIQAGGWIKCDGDKGAVGGQGNGSSSTSNTYGLTGGGGAHAGYGSASLGGAAGGTAFDPGTQPTGRGGNGAPIDATGAQGGMGGAAVHLTVNGAFIVDGKISADGRNGNSLNSGGGAGGSLWITAGRLSGAGAISANGGRGNGVGGSGGGGNIAVYFTSNNFVGTIAARGGANANVAGAGTIYTKSNNQQDVGLFTLDNGGASGAAATSLDPAGADVTLSAGAVFSSISSIVTIRNLLIQSNSWVVVSNRNSSFTVNSNATILAGGGITADGTGSAAGLGTGAGRSNSPGIPDGSASGAGHGGAGGNSINGALGGSTYDSIVDRPTAGSGGGSANAGSGSSLGGSGGGLIFLSITRNLQLEGVITANGTAGTGQNSGGGSGGGIRLSVGGLLSGSGRISVNGGAGSDPGGGGGGGGRLVLLYGSNTFSGVISAVGASGFVRGGAGTIYIQPNNQSTPQLIVDNGGLLGALTPVLSYPIVDLFIRNGAKASLAVDKTTIRSLLVGSNSILFATNLTSLFVNSNVTIAAGGVMSADGTGFVSGAGPGAGRLTGNSASGGGHGGAGGSSLSGAIGGSVYDNLQPIQAGSGGGGSILASAGGSGGGLITMNITGNLNVDGILSANGVAGTNQSSGAGAGGGISLTVGSLSGSGRISANGGAGGNSGGGGGGGGRVAVVYGTNIYSGAISAFGGSGFVFGGAGTIFFRTNNQSVGQLTFDNGGTPGGVSSLAGSGTADVTVKGGAIVSLPNLGLAPVAVRNLLISSNAFLWATNLGSLNVNNATIDFGGGIIADGAGSSSGSGQGSGFSSGGVGSGAGHGGAGVRVGATQTGGSTYDSVTAPTGFGSGGGAGTGTGTNNLGGAGGGAMRLTVTGNLQVNGFVSANATTGPGFNSGGGSGGSIWLTVGTLSGSGRISANGGAANGSGGAGGGGRIAFYYATNVFSGTVSAFGSNGSGWGGAGTIYYQANNPSLVPRVIVDNGGPSGVLSPLSVVSGADLIIKGGAATVPSSSSSTVHDLLISSNSWLSVSNATSPLTVSVSGKATIEAGGAINGDGAAVNFGLGAGSTFQGTGGGGGHGGPGSSSAAGASGGASVSSFIFMPTVPGGRGGAGQSGAGPSGGGALRMTVVGALQVDGRISVDGITGPTTDSGGSAGGSLWVTAGTLSGSGVISASGGDGNYFGGGGGGGRIALYYQSNNFAGIVIARGANGGAGAGGAGTIYTKSNDQSIGQLLVNNGGLSAAANTPLANIGVLDVTVAGGAVAYPSTLFSMVLSNLFVNSGGIITGAPGETNLTLTVLSNVVVGIDSAINVDGQGFAQANGPGAGETLGGYGSGGGYGGMGGSSWTTFGGFTYGSATQPVDPGSGGGFGSGPTYAGGSQGGGAILLNIGGILTVDGSLSANGYDALQDGAGGGSGGSIWVTARTVRGDGSITADGGSGEFFGGGGGGGGRIAIYYLTNPGHTNNFTGIMTAFGGDGEYWGDDGSVLFSAGLPMFRGISHTPVGIVSNAVASIDVTFNAAVNFFSAAGDDVILNTPNGPLLPGLITVSASSPYILHISFPQQTGVGNYSFNLGPQVTDLYGRPMSQVYTGAFSVLLPVVQGTVTGTNGLPVPGVLIQPSDATSAATTDANGNYSLGFVPGSSFALTPMRNGFMFAPGSRTYAGLTNSVAGQDYLMVTTIGPEIAAGLQDASILASWFGLPGVTYQIYSSTNLIDWLPYGPPIVGSNAPVQVPVPMGDDPAKYLRIEANN